MSKEHSNREDVVKPIKGVFSEGYIGVMGQVSEEHGVKINIIGEEGEIYDGDDGNQYQIPKGQLRVEIEGTSNVKDLGNFFKAANRLSNEQNKK